MIETGKWGQVEEKPVCEEDCLGCMYVERPIDLFLRGRYPLTPAFEALIHQMYGEEFTPSRWFSFFWHHPPSVPALRYLIQAGRISPNHPEAYTLLERSMIYYSHPHIDFLLVEAGLNVNLPSESRNTVLLTYLTYLRAVWDEEEAVEDRPEEGAECWRMGVERLENLLQRGADPLLENRDGVSALSYVEGLTTFTESQKETLLAVLRRYV